MAGREPDSERGGRPDTAGRILDIAEELIQTRGFSAISYQDIAGALGIRKASIHYHFASKTDLGIAVVERYQRRFGETLQALRQNGALSAMTLLDAYTVPFLAYADTPDRVCLCGALAGELLALPEDMRARVRGFFEAHQAWLAGILADGMAKGELRRAAEPAAMARLVFGALQGALLVKRTTGDSGQLRDVIAVLKAQLDPR